MEGNCEICGTEIEIKLCCSGRDCGCMGMPIEPPVCSSDCYGKYMAKIKKQNSQKQVPLNLSK